MKNNWTWERCGDIVDVRDGTHDTPAYVSNGIPLITSKNLKDNYIDFDSASFISYEDHEQIKRRSAVNKGDILYAMIGTIGNPVIVKDDREFSIKNVALFKLSPECFTSDFFFYLLKSPIVTQQIEAAKQGGIQKFVSLGVLRGLKIPLPPLDEQRRIAAILSEQMAEVERMLAAAEAELMAARELPRTLLKKVFSCSTFPKARLGNVCDLLPSKSIATDGDTIIQAITTACLTETGFNPSGIKRANMWASDVKDCLVSPGEILLARSNTPELVGRASLVPSNIGNVAASDLTIRVQPKNKELLPAFLAAYLSFVYVSGYWKDNAGGSSPSMKKITRTQVLDLLIPLPSLVEQQKLVEILSTQLMDVDELRIIIKTKLQYINQFPNTLLRKAFSGEL